MAYTYDDLMSPRGIGGHGTFTLNMKIIPDIRHRERSFCYEGDVEVTLDQMFTFRFVMNGKRFKINRGRMMKNGYMEFFVDQPGRARARIIFK